MLDRIEIENLRCLRSVRVPLKPLTVAIGPNDSGKTTFLDAVQVALGKRGLNCPADYWRLDDSQVPVVRVHAGGRDEAISARAGRMGQGKVIAAHQPVEYYRLPSTGPQLEGPGYDERDTKWTLPLDELGRNVPALLDWMLRHERKRFDAFAFSLREHVPGLLDVNVGTPDKSTRRVELVIEGGLKLSPEAFSTGVRLMVFFLALTYHPNPPKVMLVEEPENGFHPKRLGDVIDLLRSITRGEHCGSPAQIILATHSPYLLDHIRPDEDQVLVFRRDADGSRTADPLDPTKIKDYLETSMLGEIWTLAGEDGLTGRTP